MQNAPRGCGKYRATVRYAAATFTAAVALVLIPFAAFAADEFRVTVQAANVRQRPTTLSPVIVSVLKDTRLPVLDGAGQWVKVEVVLKGEKETGFILGTLGTIEPLTEVRADAPPAPADPPPEQSVAFNPPVPTVRLGEPSPSDIRPEPAQPTPVVTPRPTTFESAASRLVVEGGFLAANGTAGFLIGAGYVSFPFGGDEISVQADGHFVRFNSARGFDGSGNVVQYFHVPNLPFTPLAGAGVLVLKSGTDPRVGFQLVFGFDSPPMGRYTFGAQIRTLFVSGGPVTVLLGHISIGGTMKN